MDRVKTSEHGLSRCEFQTKGTKGGCKEEELEVEVEGSRSRDSTVNRIKIIRVEGKRVYI